MSPYFQVFGFFHLILLLIVLIGSLLVIFLPKMFREKAKFFIIFALIFQVIVFHFWHFYFQTYDVKTLLPLHLCSISIYLVILSLTFSNIFLKQLTFFWSPVPAFLALLLPDISSDTLVFSFRVFEFYLSHTFIVIGVVYLIFVEKVVISYRSLWQSFGILLMSASVIYLINLVFQSNYMYLIQKTTDGSMAFLPQEPYHILGFAIIFLIVWHLQYLAGLFVKPPLF